eukprot:15187351-Alexandrium_andersonii.AAC.1
MERLLSRARLNAIGGPPWPGIRLSLARGSLIIPPSPSGVLGVTPCSCFPRCNGAEGQLHPMS